MLALPLVAAAAAAAATALASLVHPILAADVGLALATAGLALATASADAPRRVLWSSFAAAAAAGALRVFVAPPDLTVALDPGVDALRERLGEPLRSLVPEPESALLLGFVLGERTGIPRDLRDAFATTGTAHLIAISGTNMTLVGAAVALALHGRMRPVAVAALGVAAIAGYTVLVGPSPSVLRAALMAAVASLGLALGRRAVAANGLGAAATAMLVLDPRAVEDVGFLLSASATGGLIAWQRPIAARLTRLPRPLAEGIAATLAASVPTTPILAAVFGRVSLISPAANLVAVPLFAPIMAFGAATAAVGAVAPTAASPLAMAAFASATALRHVVELGALVPLAAVAVPPGAPTGVACAVALAAAVFGVRRVAGARPSWLRAFGVPSIAWPSISVRPAAAMAVGAVVFAGSAATVSAFPRASGFAVHALDVGQGDAYLIESDGRYALVDGGPDGALLMRRLSGVLPPWQRRIDLVVLTHEHADHGMGLLAVLDRYAVGLALEPAGMNDVPFVGLWREHASRAGVARRAVADGAVVRVGGVTLRVLAPGRDRRVAVPSLVVHASRGTGSILFMGDATDDAIADVLLEPERLAARVYVPPHHGAETAYARALVDAVRPELALISVGARNRYGHPAPSTLAALAGVPVYRTDRYGTVDVTLDADPLAIHTAKAALPPDRGGPVPSAPAAR